jgi:hypothetical protein
MLSVSTIPLASVSAAPADAAAAASPGRWLDADGGELWAAPDRVRSPCYPRSRHLSPNPSPVHMIGHGCGRARNVPCSAGACCGATPVEPGATLVSPLSSCQWSERETPMSTGGARGSFCLAGDGAALAKAEAFLSGLHASRGRIRPWMHARPARPRSALVDSMGLCHLSRILGDPSVIPRRCWNWSDQQSCSPSTFRRPTMRSKADWISSARRTYRRTYTS